jgi:hypothetical protein
MVAKNSPSLPQNIDPNLKRAIDKQAESIDVGSGLRGSPDERWIRIRDLVDMGLAKKLAKNAQALVSGVNLVSTVAPILDIPPTPEEFVVNGGIGIVFLNWKNARELYSNHAYTEIWRAETNNLSNAVLIQQDASSFGSVDRNATYGTTYYYWIRFVSLADITGPYNSAVGTMGKLAEDPAILLEMLTGELTESQLYAALNSRIDLIDAPSTGLVAKSIENATNITNEANARLSLAQQLRGDYTGNDLTQLTTGLLKQESVTRQLGLDQLSSQMALLTAGSASQFDPAEMWYFDSGFEGWGSAGSGESIVTPGWFRPGNHATSYAVSPVFALNGGVYPQIRARIKKTGSPIWEGAVNYATAAHGSWDKYVTIPEPVFDDGIANVTWDMPAPWSSATIQQFSIRLNFVQDASNYFEIDWVAVGRPAPGASSAELFAEQLARINADTALAGDITIANAAIAGKASQSSVDSLTSRVTTAEGTITTHGNKLTALDGQVGATSILINPNFSMWTGGAYPDYWDSWSGDGISQHTGVHAYSGGKALQWSTNSSTNSGTRQTYTGPNTEYIDFEIVFTLTSGSLSGAGLHVQWTNAAATTWTTDIALKDLYVAAEIFNKKVVCKARAKRPAGFSGTYSHIVVYVMGNYAGSSLGALATKTIIFDTVFASVPDASAGAIQSLDTRMTSAEGSLTSQSSQLTLLRNSIALGTNALDTSTWVAGSTGSQGVSGQQGYWAANGVAASSTIVTAGNTGVPSGPFGGSELMWQAQSVSGDADGGYNVELAPYNKISKHRGCIFATFFRHNGLTDGSIYHGFDYSDGIANMDGSPNSNPYSVAHGVGSFTADKWYLLYGVAHPRGSQIADTGLAGIYDCTTGEKILDCGEFRMLDAWDTSTQTFRNYLFYSTDTSHKCWFARPLVTPLDVAPTPHQLMRYDSRTYANSQAISALSSTVTSQGGQITSNSTAITSLQNDVAGKASASALSTLDSRVTSTESVNTSQASAITQISARIPGGGNLAPNSDFRSNANGWYTVSDGTVSVPYLNHAGAAYIPAGYNQIGCHTSGQTAIYQDIRAYYDSGTETIPVEPGKRYCFSANTSSVRISNQQMVIAWYTETGAYISTYEVAATVSGGGNLLDYWPRNHIFATAPANARKAGLIVRGYRQSGQNEPYLWICRPMFSEVHADTTVPPPYEPSVAGAYAAIQEEATVRASETGPLVAQWTLKTQVNQLVGGVGFYNDGSTTKFYVNAQQFAVYDGSNTGIVPFIVDNGVVYMNNAMIKDATIASAKIQELYVEQLVGDKAQFVKLNVGTLVVDDIQGNMSDVYQSGTITSAFDFGGSQIPVATINIPARLNNRPFGLQFYVQGIATKVAAGSANIVADFFEPNSASAVISTHTIDAYFNRNSSFGTFGCVVDQSTALPNRTPGDWASLVVGDIVCIYLNSVNFIEGVVTYKGAIDQPTGPGNRIIGTFFALEKTATLGSVPYDGAGCTLQRRAEAGRYYRQLGITMSTVVYAATTNQNVHYNMSYYDTTNRLGVTRNVLCTIAHRSASGVSVCTNKSITFAILAGR